MLHSHFPHFFTKWYTLCSALCCFPPPWSLLLFLQSCTVHVPQFNQFPNYGQLIVSNLLLLYSAAKNPPCMLVISQVYRDILKWKRGGSRASTFAVLQIFPDCPATSLSMGAPVLLSACLQTVLANRVCYSDKHNVVAEYRFKLIFSVTGFVFSFTLISLTIRCPIFSIRMLAFFFLLLYYAS